MSSIITWHTEKRKCNDLKPCKYNPRKMNDKGKTDLTRSRTMSLRTKSCVAKSCVVMSYGAKSCGTKSLKRFNLVEIAEYCCEVIVKRWELFTNKKAVIAT